LRIPVPPPPLVGVTPPPPPPPPQYAASFTADIREPFFGFVELPENWL
jgi:hypothetical protein